MNQTWKWMIPALVFAIGSARGAAFCADEWTRPVEVAYDQKRCISYRARLSGAFLLVEAAIEPGWHTFAMDNRQRAAEKLQGRKSLSQDQPTEIGLAQGLELAGPWFQSPPKDFSRPKLRWYSWGFEEKALFAAKVRRSGAGPAGVVISGQVCTDTICRRVDVTIPLPPPSLGSGAESPDPDLTALIRVR